MATITMNNGIAKGWLEIFRTLISGFDFEDLTTDDNGTSAACEWAAELKKANRVISMAANPGEDYEKVAARIEREAARYKLFLQEPQPIGKIALNVKQLDIEEAESGASREQYHVSDPSEGKKDKSEGRASVCYTFNRSNQKVLEFIVHDEKDVPMFSIARTYSNWIGRKEFNLGRDRTFYLNMVEAVPGYVNVEAGFVPRKARHKWSAGLAALAARLINTGRRAQTALAYLTPFRRPLHVGVQFVAVTLVCCLSFWTIARVNEISKTLNTYVGDTANRLALAKVQGALEATISASTAQGVLPVSDDVGEVPVFRIVLSSHGKHATKAATTQKTKRLAAVQEVFISIDKSGCDDKENRCHQLLTSVQKGVESKLGGLNLPVPTPDPAAAAMPHSGNLVVSYQPEGQQRGNVLLTLYDQEGALLWDHKDDFDYSDSDESLFIKTYSAEASWDIVKEILLAREQANSEQGEKEVADSLSR